MSARSLAVFTRSPEPGATKTRLAPLLGIQGAVDAHIELAEATLARLQDVDAVRSLWVTTRSTLTEGWAQQFGYDLYTQSGGGLGARMAHVFLELVATEGTQACLVGTDCPAIDTAYVSEAFAALEHTDVVIGPAEDGGYGLIATSSAEAALMEALFVDIGWSSATVVAETTQRLADAGYTWTLLNEIWDVDRPEDWQRYLNYRRGRS